jgi:hypothetical protein
MSLILRLFEAIQLWRRRRGGPRTAKRAPVMMEQLDHRQLLSVNFTGKVETDFPATQSPGVVVIPDPPNYVKPVIAPDLANIVHVSGFDISELRVTYTASDDTLSIGINQPPSGNPGQPGSVIAGDADDNGNDGTVNPAVAAIRPGFQDFSDFGGSEFMEVFLDLKGTGQPDIVAGFSQTDTRSPKEYQVAQAVVNPSAPTAPPAFGTPLPQFLGNVYKVNSPVHPNLEFSITHFSQLYLQETGKTLTPSPTIGMGAAAGSAQDLGISEAFFPLQPVQIGAATLPPFLGCPPASPPVQINPHENHHVNTAHPTDVRVTIFGTSGFDVTQIIPSSVTLGGAHPIFSFTRRINRDEFLDRTFVFKGTDIHLPPGISEATVTGTLTNGQTFATSTRIFNRDPSFFSPAAQAGAQARQASNPDNIQVPVSVLRRRAPNGQALADPSIAPSPLAPSTTAAMADIAPASAPAPGTGPVVRIKRQRSKIPNKLHNSMHQYMQQADLGSAGAGAQ